MPDAINRIVKVYQGRRGASGAAEVAADIAAIRATIGVLDTQLELLDGELDQIEEKQDAITPDVDPTTLTDRDGTHKFYHGSIYYWNGAAYAIVTDASQIDPDLNEWRVYAKPKHFKRGATGAWEEETTTTATPASDAPQPPTATFTTRGDGETTYAVTPDADTGSAAITDILAAFRRAGATADERVSTGLTAAGSYTITGLQDGENPSPVFITVNADGEESAPSDPISGAAQDIAPPYVLDNGDWSAGEAQISVTLEDQPPTGGTAVTDFFYELEEVA